MFAQGSKEDRTELATGRGIPTTRSRSRSCDQFTRMLIHSNAQDGIIHSVDACFESVLEINGHGLLLFGLVGKTHSRQY
jgi:hypothetical protein